MAAVTITPASGSITHLVSACEVACSAVPNNNDAAWDPALYPSEPELAYYFKLSKTGQDSLISPRFSTNAAGIAAWHEVIIPASGTWTLGVYKNSDNSSVVTASVTVA